MPETRLAVALVGAAKCDDRIAQLAFETGQLIGQAGATLLCGGGSGVMEEGARGARVGGGTTIGILPGRDASESPPNDYIDFAVFTGMGQARNQVLVLSADVVIGVSGGWGTLSEIGLALKHRRPVVALASWELTPPDGAEEPLLQPATTPGEAVTLALAAAARGDA